MATEVHAQPADPAAPPPPAAPVAPVPETPTPANPAPESAPPAITVPDAPPPSAAPVTLVPAEPAPTPETTAPTATAEGDIPPVEDPLKGGIKFKAGKGVDIKSADGSYAFNLRLKGQIQDEFLLPTAEGALNRNNFFVRRMRLAIGGNVFTKDIKYKFEFTFAGGELSRQPASVGGATPASMGGTVATSRDVVQQAPLLDMYLDFVQLRDLSLRIGQAKPSYGRERVITDSDLHTVDRSIDDAEFNIDRDMGIELRSLDLGGIDKFRYYLGIYAAEDRNSSVTSLGTGDFGWLYFARLETVPMGSFEETPVDFARSAPKLSFGVAYAFLQTDSMSQYAANPGGLLMPTSPSGRQFAVVDYGSHNFTADFLFKAAGFSALGAFHYRKLADLPEDVIGKNGLGFVLQAHYLVSKEVPLGLTANVSMVRRVGEEDESSIVERSEAGGGIGYYFYDHALKIEAEFEHLWWEPVGDEPREPDNRLRLQLSFII